MRGKDSLLDAGEAESIGALLRETDELCGGWLGHARRLLPACCALPVIFLPGSLPLISEEQGIYSSPSY